MVFETSRPGAPPKTPLLEGESPLRLPDKIVFGKKRRFHKSGQSKLSEPGYFTAEEFKNPRPARLGSGVSDEALRPHGQETPAPSPGALSCHCHKCPGNLKSCSYGRHNDMAGFGQGDLRRCRNLGDRGSRRAGAERCSHRRRLAQNWRRNRRSLSKKRRMSSTPYFSMAMRSMPSPKAKPV